MEDNKALPIYFMSPAISSPPLKEALDAFNEKWWLNVHSYHDNLRLFHYTNLDGLMGILNNRSLWCSHIRTLNDPSELQYGKNLVLSYIDKYLKNNNDKEIIDLLEHLKLLINGFEFMFHAFVGCFCKEDNVLSQWRNYSANGGGYSLGFRFNSNTNFSHNGEDINKTSHIILRKIIYSPAVQVNYIKVCLDYIITGSKDTFKWFKKTGHDIPADWGMIAANEAINILFDIILSFKDPAFSEEKEWRIIKVVRDDDRPDLYKFRDSKSLLIPYLDTYIYEKIGATSIFPLESITYGPMLEKEITESILKLFLINSHRSPISENIIEINSGTVTINSAGFKIRS